ncbi:hypothetical protein ABFS82_14G184900 [Erythranthe guttata]
MMMSSIKMSSVIGSYWLMLIVFTCWINAKSGETFGTFGFDIHHRYSDTVKEFLNTDRLPEKGTFDYYTAMAHRDHLFKARRLASASAKPPVMTFFGGNESYYVNELGFLHYSFISVGTPPLTFLVALDTGGDLFWLPCDCITCTRGLYYKSTGKLLKLNIYSPSTSRTSAPVPCNSTMCVKPKRGCSSRLNACSYEEIYSNSSTSGILVNDVLHLGTNVIPQDIVDVPITLGCGKTQTGSFLDSGGINGVFGLGMDNISVPSVLANRGLVANSFSLCFGSDGQGRILFGDKGSPLQKTTPFNLQKSVPNYNITVTQIAVGNTATDIEFTAIFDSGIAFTYLTEPAYSFIVKTFDSLITETRAQPQLIFEYCYALKTTQYSYTIPKLILTMKGGSQFTVVLPTLTRHTSLKGGHPDMYCLAIVKSEDINIIGENFMTGYNIVFDREEMVLGWEESNCYGNKGNSSHTPKPNGVARLNSMTTGLLVMVILVILSHHFIVLSS